MPGDERTRFCDRCSKHVHDLSARTEIEARELLARHRGSRLCVRVARDSRGMVVFRAAGAAAVLSLAACGPTLPNEPPVSPAVVDHDMGDTIPDELDRCPDPPAPNDIGCPWPGEDAGAKPD